MKTLSITLFLLFFGFVSHSQAIKQPQRAKPAPALTLSTDDEVRFKIANDIAINLVEGKFNLVTNNFDATFKANAKEDAVRTTWFQMTSWRGNFIRIDSITPGLETGLVTMNVVCHFDNGYAIIVAVFKDKQVAGLWIR